MARFESHAKQFDQLAELVTQYPNLVTVRETAAAASESKRLGAPANAVAEFVALKKEIGYDRKLAGGVYGLGVLSLVVYDAPGMAGSNHLLGYVLSPTEELTRVPSLSAWDPNATHSDTAIRHLSGSWFIFEIRQ